MTLGSAVVVSVAVHAAAIAIAMLAFGRHAPAAEEPAAITVFVPPAAEPVEEKPVEPPKPDQPPPAPDFTLPPPEESLAIPDFKPPPPPPPKVATSPPKPASPPKPPAVAQPQTAPSAPQQIVPPVNNAPSPSAAPAIVPGWNVALAAWLAAHKRGVEGEVLIAFTVEPDGHVIEVTVAKGSGHAELDAAAVGMLQGATVPPPGAAAKRTVRIHFRLDD